MAYCSECGVFYTGEQDNCPSCGRHVTNSHKADPFLEAAVDVPFATNSVELTSEGKDPGTDNLKNSREISSPSLLEPENESQFVTEFDKSESQLGKGIIKPQKIEMAVDGFHFKYGTPSHSFRKEGPVKEKPKEYRVTNDDMELKSYQTLSPEKPLQEEIPPLPAQKPGNMAAEEYQEVETAESRSVEHGSTPETVPMDKAVEPVVLDDDQQREIDRETPGNEFMAEPILPEPEINESENDEIVDDAVVWEGVQTWLRIPMGKRYKVTRRSLIIYDKDHYQLLDIRLKLIVEMSVKQSWLARLLDIGDLLILIPEFAASKIVLNGISEPFKVKRMIEQLLNEALIRGIE